MMNIEQDFYKLKVFFFRVKKRLIRRGDNMEKERLIEKIRKYLSLYFRLDETDKSSEFTSSFITYLQYEINHGGCSSLASFYQKYKECLRSISKEDIEIYANRYNLFITRINELLKESNQKIEIYKRELEKSGIRFNFCSSPVTPAHSSINSEYVIELITGIELLDFGNAFIGINETQFSELTYFNKYIELATEEVKKAEAKGDKLIANQYRKFIHKYYMYIEEYRELPERIHKLITELMEYSYDIAEKICHIVASINESYCQLIGIYRKDAKSYEVDYETAVSRTDKVLDVLKDKGILDEDEIMTSLVEIDEIVNRIYSGYYEGKEISDTDIEPELAILFKSFETKPNEQKRKKL